VLVRLLLVGAGGFLGAAWINVGAQVALGLLAVWAGLSLARAWA